MRGAIGEVNMDVIDAVAREKVREVKSVASALLCLDARAVFAFMKIDKHTWPFAARLCLFFPEAQNWLRRRVMNRCAQPGDMLVAQAGQRRINRPNFKRPPEPFQREHLHVAKGVRDDRVTRVEITESHRPSD